MLSTIRTKLATKLQTLVTNGDLQAYFDHEPELLNTYPCATLSFVRMSDEIHDTAANLREVTFTIRIYVKNADKSQSETDIVTATWEVIQAIETDPTLDGSVLSCVCSSAERTNDIREMEVSYVDISVKAMVRVNR